MALKSNREGLRPELVDYLGNIIIDKKLKNDIINSINNVYVNESDVLTLEEIQASSDLSGKVAGASTLKTNEIIATNVSSIVTDHRFFKSGNIIFGRMNFTYSSSPAVLCDLPSPVEYGYFYVQAWENGKSVNGSVFIGPNGNCSYYGDEFTGNAGCLLIYLCA